MCSTENVILKSVSLNVDSERSGSRTYSKSVPRRSELVTLSSMPRRSTRRPHTKSGLKDPGDHRQPRMDVSFWMCAFLHAGTCASALLSMRLHQSEHPCLRVSMRDAGVRTCVLVHTLDFSVRVRKLLNVSVHRSLYVSLSGSAFPTQHTTGPPRAQNNIRACGERQHPCACE